MLLPSCVGRLRNPTIFQSQVKTRMSVPSMGGRRTPVFSSLFRRGLGVSPVHPCSCSHAIITPDLQLSWRLVCDKCGTKHIPNAMKVDHDYLDNNSSSILAACIQRAVNHILDHSLASLASPDTPKTSLELHPCNAVIWPPTYVLLSSWNYRSTQSLVISKMYSKDVVRLRTEFCPIDRTVGWTG